MIDGIGISMPDADELRALRRALRASSRVSNFPVAHLLALVESATGLSLKAWASLLRTHDLKDAAKLHPALEAGDVLVGNAAFASYAHLALIFQQQLQGLFRIHQRSLVSFRGERRLIGKRPKGSRRRGPPAA